MPTKTLAPKTLAPKSRRGPKLRLVSCEPRPPRRELVLTPLVLTAMGGNILELLSFAEFAALENWERPPVEKCLLVPGFGVLAVRENRDMHDLIDVRDCVAQAVASFWDDVAMHEGARAAAL